MSFDLLIVVRSADFKNYILCKRDQESGFYEVPFVQTLHEVFPQRSFHNFAIFYGGFCKSTVWLWLSVLVLRKIQRK